ncbi:MAG TPA: GNAT family N-acetyltransferase [Anaerolineaceae bacterium]
MTLTSRGFRSEDDLFAMRRLLLAGRQANTSAYYIHGGDLLWWYGYYVPELDLRRCTTLWESDLFEPGELAAWALFSPNYDSLDVFLHPALRGTPQAAEIWTAAEEGCAVWRDTAAGHKLNTIWIGANDAWTINHLLSRGFTLGAEYADVMLRPLTTPLEPPVLPPGFALRSLQPETDITARANPQYAAFGSRLPLDVYYDRYARFLRSSSYPLCIDTLLLAPGGRGAAFCITWPDEVNRVGLFEPVGVDPAFHRQGLGRMVVTEGLRRLQAAGMTSAIVCGLSDLPGARAFYASLGFAPVLRLLTYEKA